MFFFKLRKRVKFWNTYNNCIIIMVSILKFQKNKESIMKKHSERPYYIIYLLYPKIKSISQIKGNDIEEKKLRRHTVQIKKSHFSDSTSFLMVRHPFHRLLSAFRHKLERQMEDPTFYKIGNFFVIHKYKTVNVRDMEIYKALWFRKSDVNLTCLGILSDILYCFTDWFSLLAFYDFMNPTCFDFLSFMISKM